ncbi:MAG: tetratricopeptide repeat protein [Paludibacteraceae bacterium]|nr:tetratricopeptide repeat protein [Paludibacteraceae bacterium]
MKRIFIFFLSILPIICFASESKRFAEANDLYSLGKFKEADSLYQVVLQEEGSSAALYYNLGNAKYKQGEIAPAILNYERALKLDPNNEDILFNLEMAKQQTTDKIEQLDNFFISDWNKSIQNTFSSDGWAKLSIFCFIFTLICVSIYFFGKIGWLRKASFFTSIFTILMCIISFHYAKNQKNILISHDYAIIFAPSVTGKGSPDNGGTDLFLLHEGTKVKIKSKLNGWVEIQIADGNVGWIPEKCIEII